MYQQLTFLSLAEYNQPSNRYEDTLPAMLNIKEWVIKKGMDAETIIKSKNYWVFP